MIGTFDRYLGAIQNTFAYCTDVADALRSLYVIAVIVAGIEEVDVVFADEAFHSGAGGGLCAEIGEYQKVGGAEGIAAESVMGVAVNESGGAGCVSRSENNFNLAPAKVKDLSVSQVALRAFVAAHVLPGIDFIGGIYPDFVPFIDGRAGMV